MQWAAMVTALGCALGLFAIDPQSIMVPRAAVEILLALSLFTAVCATET